MFPARQWGLVDVVAGGADDAITTKGLTGSMYLSEILCCRLSVLSRGPWKGASGHTRLVREHWSSVAADRRRYLGVYLHSRGAVGRFFA